ncbi:hypothetical protein LSUE1_G006265 [Lachnellula suecica]|uniref:Integral membrane protein n=1 Tax=Lachnellula suecica TaxID=602035 RepID=A0A8T9BWS8_9HELO|nr:hypothetical protein LSUE1_G006265 [Lachnellula suecica]
MKPTPTLLFLLTAIFSPVRSQTPRRRPRPLLHPPHLRRQMRPPLRLQATSTTCFCADARLTPFSTSTADIESICGGSCTAASDLTALQTWYEGFCKSTGTTTTAAGGAATATGTSAGSATTSSSGSSGVASGSGKAPTWIAAHWKWVVMLIVLFVAITLGWTLAILFRRRYLRKREKEIEMRPPVAIGPHQVQAMSGGYSYGDGVVDVAGRKSGVGEGVTATPADGRKKGGWLRKDRK